MFVRVRRTREHRHRKTEMGVRAARDSFILMHLLRSFFSPLPFRPRTYAHTFFRRDANTFTRRFKKGYKLSCVVSSETTDKKSSPPKDVSSNEPPKSDFQSHVSLGFFGVCLFRFFLSAVFFYPKRRNPIRNTSASSKSSALAKNRRQCSASRNTRENGNEEEEEEEEEEEVKGKEEKSRRRRRRRHGKVTSHLHEGELPEGAEPHEEGSAKSDAVYSRTRAARVGVRDRVGGDGGAVHSGWDPERVRDESDELGRLGRADRSGCGDDVRGEISTNRAKDERAESGAEV